MLDAREYVTLDEWENLSILDAGDVPTIIVEGVTDVPFVRQLLKCSAQFQTHEYLVVVTGAKSKCLDLYSTGKLRRGCAILLDRDHDEFKGLMVDDRLVVYTHYYSFESYLVREHVVGAMMRQQASDVQLKQYSYRELIRSIAHCTVLSTRICALKVMIGGEWLEIPCQSEAVWKFADQETMEPNLKRAQDFVAKYVSEGKEIISRPVSCSEWARCEFYSDSFDQDFWLKVVPGKHVLDALERYLDIHFPSLGKKISNFRDFLCGFVGLDRLCSEVVSRLEEAVFQSATEDGSGDARSAVA